MYSLYRLTNLIISVISEAAANTFWTSESHRCIGLQPGHIGSAQQLVKYPLIINCKKVKDTNSIAK